MERRRLAGAMGKTLKGMYFEYEMEIISGKQKERDGKKVGPPGESEALESALEEGKERDGRGTERVQVSKENESVREGRCRRHDRINLGRAVSEEETSSEEEECNFSD